MEGDQGGGARGVDGDGGAFQAEHVRDTPGGDAARAAAALVAVECREVDGGPGRVVVVHEPGEDTGAGAAQPVGGDSGALERLPGHLEEQPLLRIHGLRLARVDAEEPGVEPVGVGQEAAVPGVRPAGRVRIGVVELLDVPAPVVGELGHRVDAVGDQPPEVLGRRHASRVAARHGDDRNRLGVLAFEVAHLQPGAVQLATESGQVVAQFLVLVHRCTTRFVKCRADRRGSRRVRRQWRAAIGRLPPLRRSRPAQCRAAAPGAVRRPGCGCRRAGRVR